MPSLYPGRLYKPIRLYLNFALWLYGVPLKCVGKSHAPFPHLFSSFILFLSWNHSCSLKRMILSNTLYRTESNVMHLLLSLTVLSLSAFGMGTMGPRLNCWGIFSLLTIPIISHVIAPIRYSPPYFRCSAVIVSPPGTLLLLMLSFLFYCCRSARAISERSDNSQHKF